MRPIKQAAWSIQQRRWEWALGAGCLLAMAWLLWRSLGLYPAVFADELFYSNFARLVPLSDASVPSYLYYVLYRSTNACGPAFLDCARGLNVLLFVAAAPFIYLSARQVAGKGAALAVALLSLLLPVSTYTAYFMPEGLYFLAFFVLTWVVLTRTAMHWAAHALLCGLILGAMTLIKIHAMFLLPPLCLFAVYGAWARDPGTPWLARAAGAVALIVLAVFTVKFGLGYLMGGAGALHMFGSFYGGQAHASSSRPLSSYLVPAWINGRGHLMALAILFALPIALALHSLVWRALRQAARAPLFAAQLYTLLMIGAALAMTFMYTASIADLAPREIERLHMRYYDFAFPLLLLVCAAARDEARRPRWTWLRAILGLALAAGIVLGLYMLPGYKLSMVDGPDIATLFAQDRLPHHIVQFQLVLLVVWLAGWTRMAASAFLFLFMPVLLVSQNSGMALQMAEVSKPNAFDIAGQYVRDQIPRSEQKHVAIAAASLPLLMRAKFYVDEPALSMIELPPESEFRIEQLPMRHKWLLVMAPNTVPAELAPVLTTPQFSLIKIVAPHRKLAAADFNQAPGTGLIAAIDGVHKIEPWGRWTKDKRVTITLGQPLPKKLSLLLKGQSYGPNAQQDYVLHVGGQQRRFRIGHAPTEVFLRFDTDGRQRTLAIDVPQPVAPRDIENSADDRPLGLGLISLEVGEQQ